MAIERNSLYEEIKNYISSSYFSIRKIPDGCDNLKALVSDGNIDKVENANALALACKSIPNGEYLFTCFFKGLSKLSVETAKQIYSQVSSEAGTVPEAVPALAAEIKTAFACCSMEEIGFFQRENSKSYDFNANVFVKHLLKRIKVVTMENGCYAVYNKSGYYEIVSDKIVGKIIRYIMHEVKRNIWTSGRESEVFKALSLEAAIKELNTNRHYLNLENGMLNIDTFELKEHDPSYLSTVRIPFSYDKNAKCPRFRKFISETTMGDDDLALVLQEMTGYLLTSETKAEKAFILFGPGANGKSVFSKVIQTLVGEANASHVSLSQFSKQFGLQSIIGKTVNISNENELANARMNTENLKAIISGDPVTISIKYKDDISYTPVCKLVFLVNTLPATSDMSYGYFRKLMIIPFFKKFSDEEKDIDLLEKLKKEMPGILNWAIEGLQRLNANRHQFTKSVKAAEMLELYKSEQNPVIKFFSDCIVVDPESHEDKKVILQAYAQWLYENGIDDRGSKTSQRFWKLFENVLADNSLSYIEGKNRGTRFVRGIQLKERPQENLTLDF